MLCGTVGIIPIILLPLILPLACKNSAVAEFYLNDRIKNRYLILMLAYKLTKDILWELAYNGYATKKTLNRQIEKSYLRVSKKVISKMLTQGSLEDEALEQLAEASSGYLEDIHSKLICGLMEHKLYHKLCDLSLGEIIEALSAEGYNKKNLSGFFEKKDVGALNEWQRRWMLYHTDDDSVVREIISLGGEAVLIAAAKSGKISIVRDVFSEATPDSEKITALIGACRYEGSLLEICRNVILRHGLNPRIAENIYRRFKCEYIFPQLRKFVDEREDKVIIDDRSVDDLKNLIQKRDLTDYGQKLLLDIHDYNIYVVENRKKIAKANIPHLLANADDEVFEALIQDPQIREEFSLIISARIGYN